MFDWNNVDDPEPDFVGLSIEVSRPGESSFRPLRNRLNVSYKESTDKAVNGFRKCPSTFREKDDLALLPDTCDWLLMDDNISLLKR